MKRKYSKPFMTTINIVVKNLMGNVSGESDGRGAKRNNVDFPDWDKLDD